jgi:mono/diheme cytochrome c family protein
VEVVAFLIPFVLLGIGVLFVAFSGGPGAAREAYLTRGGRAFKIIIPILYIGLGVAVPALVMINREASAGGTGHLRTEDLNSDTERGKQLFRQQCASCHSLEAVNARGVTGPDLDEIGEVTPERVENAIRIGGTGQDRMPAGLLRGQDAREVAEYVSEVAGQ